MDTKLTGGCACGDVRYELMREPMFVHCCHCMDCQRQTGSAFAVNGLIETDQIAVNGLTPVATRMPTDSGRMHDIYRCPSCQTALWSDYGDRSYLRFVRMGTLDDPGRISPDVHIFTRSKREWVSLPPEVPSFEVYYDMREQWPAGSLARRQAASDAAKSQ